MCLLSVCSVNHLKMNLVVQGTNSHLNSNKNHSDVSSEAMLYKHYTSISHQTNFYKSKMQKSVVEVKPAVAGCSSVSVGRQGHICKMKGEAAVGCFHRGMERSGSGPSTNTRLIVQVQGNTEWGFHSVSSAL